MRRLLAATIGAIAIAFLGGCASGKGVVDACPYVKDQNPSLLQGKSNGGEGGVTASF